MIQRAAIVKYLANRRQTIAFWVVAALGLFVALEANLAPYYMTRGAYGFDGLEIIGFPFVFRSVGGFSFAFEFSHLALSADIAIAVIFSFAVGAMARRLVGRIGRRSRFAWCAGPPPRRAPWQFSLQQMLFIVVLVAAACAVDKYVAAEMNQWP
jgi:hypothetical protein